MKTNKWLASGLLAVAGLSSPAWAALGLPPPPRTATLTFDTPSANVLPNEVIPIYLTLTLDADSLPLITDAAGMLGSASFLASELPGGFQVDFSGIGQSSSCTSSFTSNCASSGAPYTFSFIKVSQSPLPFLPNLNLQAGESTSFLFGELTPNGSVAPGTYSQASFGLFLEFTDITSAPASPPWSTSIFLTNTCDDVAGSCSFQRTVIAAVPEPETYAMLLAGLGLMGWVVRRRARA